ncbi:MAG: DUF2130 domain-containing protein [Candidatus Kapabacteria bacterium]|nr:DUF2130 domain-containing protein [Candidatus Kapabacteria bacterium]
MNEIKCPHCGKAFTIDEAGYAEIMKQVRDGEFDKEIHARLELAEKDKRTAIELAEANLRAKHERDAAEKDREIQRLNDSVRLEQERRQREIENTAAAKEMEIQNLRSKLEQRDTQQQLAIKEAVDKAERERDEMKSSLEKLVLQRQLEEKGLKERYEAQIKDRDEQIERMRDMKAKLSTKMLGETLEQHCEISFNSLRAAAFPNAYFEKDNDARSGSKGDYIFREADEHGNEIVSIMFEMKNEADTTATKKKNDDFLKELDKDRSEKNCEYAVLVSLLEPENELYNGGIVDVSHRYAKMYVVRPQFFIPIITLLRNASMKTLQYKAELALVKAQNIDVTNFEEKLEEFKGGFARNFDLASRKFQTAIEEIDKSISHLQKTKEALLGTNNNLRLANEKVQDVSIKKLTKDSPSVRAMFEEKKAR